MILPTGLSMPRGRERERERERENESESLRERETAGFDTSVEDNQGKLGKAEQIYRRALKGRAGAGYIWGVARIAGCSGRNRFGSVWFGSVPDISANIPFGSVRFGQITVPVRRASARAFRTRRGSVRFGLVCFPVRFRPVPE